MRRVLSLWVARIIPSEAVVAWADKEILRAEQPTKELIALAVDGPEVCLKRSQYEFSARPAEFGYETEFAFRAIATDLGSAESCENFVDWASKAALRQNLELDEVAFGYQLDHLIADCNDVDAAIEFIRTSLPRLLPQCHEQVLGFLAQIPNMELDADTHTCRST